MAKKSEDLEALVSTLMDEREELDGQIEGLIADMGEAPPEARTSGDWSPNGTLTRKYLELTNRQAEVEKDIIDLSRQIAAGGGTGLPN